ncbi:hypothetical protein K9L97_01320 [Candidatus Woesearchaeota archaeon]|nr:hypothetical protein [Candidatus Woesearchaeota archaeon]
MAEKEQDFIFVLLLESLYINKNIIIYVYFFEKTMEEFAFKKLILISKTDL